MLSELRLVYHVALRRPFRTLFGLSGNDRSSSLCNAPLKRVA